MSDEHARQLVKNYWQLRKDIEELTHQNHYPLY